MRIESNKWDYFNWDNSHSIELELRRCHFVNEIKLIVYQLKSCVMKLNQFSHDKTMSCLKSKHQRFLMISIFPSKTVEEAINEILVNVEQDFKCLLEFKMDASKLQTMRMRLFHHVIQSILRLQYCLNGDYICCKTYNVNLNTLRFLRCYRIFGGKAQSIWYSIQITVNSKAIESWNNSNS